MKKKYLNIVLLVGVVLIWGVLIYKFLGNSFTDQDDQQNYTETIYGDIPVVVKKDTFNLKGYTRDPFLGKIKNTNKSATKGVNRRVVKVVKPVAVIQWPQLQYFGFVKEEKAKEPLLLLKVNGRLMRKKSSFEFYDGMEILNFYRDSILVKYAEKQKTIKKG